MYLALSGEACFNPSIVLEQPDQARPFRSLENLACVVACLHDEPDREGVVVVLVGSDSELERVDAMAERRSFV